ncbi:MAG: arylsulfatase [Planctomycetes bacterium]|nr:arylsulfatase [Planctomycetota bacterium]
MRALFLALALSACLHNGDAPAPRPAEQRPPNIVLVYTDDQGWADIGSQGARGFATPNIDRLAQEGVRFTNFYVAQPVCSASRAALLTGCYPNRLGISGALGPGAKHGLHRDETTLAELCRGAGYATAMFGKWHLGHRLPFLPVHHGFDEFYGIPYSNDMWPWHPNYAHFSDPVERRKRGYPDLPLFEGDKVVDDSVDADDQRAFTRGFTERATDFIRKHRDEPFFLYLAHPMPHVPLFVDAANEGRTERGLYGDVIAEIDDSVGALLDTLAECGIDDNTLFIYASDNGPWLSYGDHGGSTGPLREGKGTTFEGGVRVPGLARFPGQIPAGLVCDEPLMTIDILPTVAGLIGAPLPERPIDGRNAWPLFQGEKGAHSPQEAYFFYYRVNDLEAMRSGKWKLHFPHGYRSMAGRELGSGGSPGKYDYSVRTGLELYDLEADIGERVNLAAEHPQVVERLTALADAMRAELGDNLTEAEGAGQRAPGRWREVSIFNGTDLAGWRELGDAHFSVEDGEILGKVGGGRQSFLVTEGSFADFRLELELKAVGPGNSGVQVRSHQRPSGQLYGYQIEVDPSPRSWSGGLYDEGRRAWLDDLADNPAGRAAFEPGQWNSYRIECIGNRIRAWVNGVATADFIDGGEEADAEGFIGLQVHSGNDCHMRWRNLRLLELER